MVPWGWNNGSSYVAPSFLWDTSPVNFRGEILKDKQVLRPSGEIVNLVENDVTLEAPWGQVEEKEEEKENFPFLRLLFSN
ncbi:hypothetical protein M8J76_005676 [Diaphorina citri]|nr:hypothetical protein M8J75_010685 [Diaphorina citri]KAI5723424.1 hypothetical protein M8J76_005676 [Diaphorina citri]